MSTLREIVNQANIVEGWLIEASGELTPEIEQLLAEVNLQEVQKIDGYEAVMGRMAMAEEFYQARAERLAAVARGCARFRERLRDRIRMLMLETRREEVSGSEIRFKIVKGADKLVMQPEKVPDSFKVVVTEKIPDKERIKAALKSGAEVPGACLEPSYQLRTYAAKGAQK